MRAHTLLCLTPRFRSRVQVLSPKNDVFSDPESPSDCSPGDHIDQSPASVSGGDNGDASLLMLLLEASHEIEPKTDPEPVTPVDCALPPSAVGFQAPTPGHLRNHTQELLAGRGMSVTAGLPSRAAWSSPLVTGSSSASTPFCHSARKHSCLACSHRVSARPAPLTYPCLRADFATERTPAGATALSGGISPHDPSRGAAPRPSAQVAPSKARASASGKKSVHPAPRRRAPAQKSEELPYDQLWEKLPKGPSLDAAELVAVFLRDELRSLLKRNGVSYHRPGPKNMMKSKTEMADDLIGLMQKNELRTPERLAAEEKAGIAPMQVGSKHH